MSSHKYDLIAQLKDDIAKGEKDWLRMHPDVNHHLADHFVKIKIRRLECIVSEFKRLRAENEALKEDRVEELSGED